MPIARAVSENLFRSPWAHGLPYFVLAMLLASCQSVPKIEDHTKALSLSNTSLSSRQIQTRRFDTGDEASILSACAGVLQDLGFNIDESAADSGLLVASKDRDAVEAGQVAGQVFMVMLAAAFGVQAEAVWDKNQKIRISIVTQKASEKTVLVRVTFQRVIRNTKNQISKAETIEDPKIYQEFFDKLSQSVFLEGHKI